MNYKMVGRIGALFLAVEAVFMLPAMLIALFDGDWHVFLAFAASVGVLLAVSVPVLVLTRKSKGGFYAKEGLVSVGLGWMILSLFGGLPFFLSGEIPHFVDALFEIVSGFTTTGASIVPDVEVLSRGILYWRSFSHWLGGMGVLVFLLAVAPVGGKNEGFTMHLLRAESPGPNVGKLVPKMRRTAAILYLIYVLLTVVDFLMLVAGRMPVLDAVCTAFGTAGTGGFGIKADSMGSYSPYLQNVTTVFMLLFGVNFSCYYMILLGQIKSVWRDEEFRLYWCMVLAAGAVITLNIRGMYGSIWTSMRHAFFQVASISTTTGFGTTDFNLWPTFSKSVLLILMAVGASAGSTGGGFKCARLLLILRTLKRNIQQMMHPNSVRVIRMNGQPVDERVIANTNAYLGAYVVILAVSFLLVSFDSVTMTTAFSATLSCFNNIGPGLDQVGPAASYAGLSYLSKIVLTLDMLAGRLEIFPVLILFGRDTWKRY